MIYSRLKVGDCVYRTLGAAATNMYNLVGGLGFLSVYIYNFIMFRYKKNFLSNCTLVLSKNKKRNIWICIEIFIISCVQYLPIGFLNTKLASLLNTGANYFGLIYFIPLFLFPFFYLISINPFKQMDLITPAYPLALIFAKLACFCNGCCGGVECSWGLVNYYYQENPIKEFPVQLVEAALALIIFIFLVSYRKKAKEGTLFPIYVIAYSVTRFFSEFVRNEPNIFGILKLYHILCAIGVILGTAELLLVLKYSEKVKPYFDRPVFKRFTQKKESTKNKKDIVHHKKRKK